MLKIKQINAKVRCNIWHIDDPLNAFIASLPQKGKEVRSIQYFQVRERGEMGIQSAIVEYEGDETDNTPC